MANEKGEGLHLNVKFKVVDVFRYNLYVAYQSIVSKILVIVGIALIGWLVYKFQHRIVDMDIFITQNIVWIILPIFILIATPWKVWTITATQMQAPVFSKGAEYDFYKDKIVLTANDMTDEVPWETYRKIIETSNDFRFFVDKVQAQILPKHNMDARQITELKKIIKEANPKEIYKLK
ncbi:MAG: YcxB family protein [Cellulosilyticaceae bacterium]